MRHLSLKRTRIVANVDTAETEGRATASQQTMVLSCQQCAEECASLSVIRAADIVSLVSQRR